MAKKKPRRRHAAGRESSSQIRVADTTRRLAQKQPRPAPTLDLVGLRERLLEARRRLLERIAQEYDPERTYPDTAWTRMVADIQAAIAAVDDVLDEGRP